MISDIIEKPKAWKIDAKKNSQSNHKAHDRFVRVTLSSNEPAKQFIAMHLGKKYSDLFDWSTLQAEKTDFIGKDLREKVIDVVWSIQSKDKSYSVIFLIEHYASNQKDLGNIMHRRRQVIEDYYEQKSTNKKIPVVFAFALYQPESTYKGSVDYYDRYQNPELAREIGSTFTLINVHDFDDTTLINRGDFAGCFQFILKNIYRDDLEELIAENLDLFKMLSQEAGGIDFIYNSANYMLNKGKIPIAHLEEFAKMLGESINNPQLTGDIMSTAEQLKQQGIKEEKHTVAINLLREHVSETVIKRATGLSSAEIEDLKKEI